MSVSAALNQALQHFKAGKTDEARRMATELRRRYPNDFDALYFSGWLCLRTGDEEQGVVHIERALANGPGHADAYFNLAAAQKKLGRLSEAAGNYSRAVEIAPGNAAAHFNLGNVLADLGEAEQAVACYQKALRLDPGLSQAHFNLGLALNGLGRFKEAVESLQRATGLDPGDAAAHYNLGTALSRLDRLDEAAEALTRALEIDPDNADALSNLGAALEDMNRTDEAVARYRRALAIDPDHADALNNMGAALLGLDKADEALDHFHRALKTDPNHAGAHCNLSSVLLARGELPRGWAEYEWRWRRASPPMRRRNFPQPRWDGSPLKGKSILLTAEQGVGDEICFASMIPDIIAMGADCAVECEPRLVNLFARSFPQARVYARPYLQAESGEAAFDCQISMGSLPGFLRTAVGDFPERQSYLAVNQERQRLWRDRLAALGNGLKVGLSWRSGLMTHSRRIYFAALADMEPLLRLDNTIFVNLQYDQCADELAEAEKRFGAAIHAWDDIDLMNDLDGAAALTSCLNAVVTPLTSVYEMGGALGVPTFAFHPPHPCIVALGTDGVPFYPSARVIRRRVGEDWSRVFARIASELTGLKF